MKVRFVFTDLTISMKILQKTVVLLSGVFCLLLSPSYASDDLNELAQFQKIQQVSLLDRVDNAVTSTLSYALKPFVPVARLLAKPFILLSLLSQQVDGSHHHQKDCMPTFFDPDCKLPESQRFLPEPFYTPYTGLSFLEEKETVELERKHKSQFKKKNLKNKTKMKGKAECEKALIKENCWNKETLGLFDRDECKKICESPDCCNKGIENLYYVDECKKLIEKINQSQLQTFQYDWIGTDCDMALKRCKKIAKDRLEGRKTCFEKACNENGVCSHDSVGQQQCKTALNEIKDLESSKDQFLEKKKYRINEPQTFSTSRVGRTI